MNKVISSAKGGMIKGSVFKLSLVTKLLLRKNAVHSLKLLESVNKRVAVDIKKVLNAAIANAQNNSSFEDVGRLVIGNIDVGKSFSLKRFRARARGRSSRINKKFSMVRIDLMDV